MKPHRLPIELESNLILNLGEYGICFFKDPNNTIAIMLQYDLYDLDWYDPLKIIEGLNRRIFMDVFPLENLLKDYSAILIKKEVIITLKDECYPYSLTYQLKLDPRNRTVSIQLLEKKGIDEDCISNQEINGITKFY